MRTMVALALSVSLFTASLSASAEEAKRPNFPMPSSEFQTRMAVHVEKARTRLEARIAKNKVDAEEAKVLRARFENAIAKTKLASAKATADGTVTREEAKEVRAVARAGRRHGHRQHHSQRAGAKEADK
jgi:hypothetical protein